MDACLVPKPPQLGRGDQPSFIKNGGSFHWNTGWHNLFCSTTSSPLVIDTSFPVKIRWFDRHGLSWHRVSQEDFRRLNPHLPQWRHVLQQLLADARLGEMNVGSRLGLPPYHWMGIMENPSISWSYRCCLTMGLSIVMGVPQNGWFVMETIEHKMHGEQGCHLFRKPPYLHSPMGCKNQIRTVGHQLWPCADVLPLNSARAINLVLSDIRKKMSWPVVFTTRIETTSAAQPTFLGTSPDHER